VGVDGDGDVHATGRLGDLPRIVHVAVAVNVNVNVADCSPWGAG
jgi:hypothetical protein